MNTRRAIWPSLVFGVAVAAPVLAWALIMVAFILALRLAL